MANTFNWYSTASSCPGAQNTQPGWYSGETFITASYQNPTTGLAYTPQELEGLMGGGISGGTPTTATGGGTTPLIADPGVANMPEGWVATGGTEPPPPNTGPSHIGMPVGPHQFDGQPISTGQAPTMPTFGAGVPLPEVTAAPPYEKTPEQIAFEGMYAGKLTDWVETGGYGIPEETQAQMIQQQTDSLKASETESLRVMRNTMERRGLTNSGLLYANEQAIRSNTSVAIAGAIADVQIKSALMKMASFEKAMGAAGQFLNYLSTQTQLAYQPQFATWQAQQMAKMQQWQGQLDLMKMEINQAYQTQNLTLQAQLTSQLAEQQHGYDLEMNEMELEAMNQQAASEGAGSIWGTALEGLFTIAAITL